MTNLSEFLLISEVETTKKVELTGRTYGHPFTIKSMTNDELKEYRKASQTFVNGRQQIDENKLNMLMIKNHVLDPNFKDSEMIEKAKVNTPEELINKVLNFGEISALTLAILELSGFNTTFEEHVQEAKN